MRSPAIPTVPKPSNDRSRFDQAVKETLELLTGNRGDSGSAALLLSVDPGGGRSVTNVQSAIREAIVGSSSQTHQVAPATAGTMAPAASQMIGRNLIVNGSCQVDQVNSGAIISPLVNGNYVVDNLGYYQTQTGKLSGQQITTSTLNTLGSTHAARATVLSQYTPISTDEFEYLFYVEGLNLAHLQWGTANASSVSLQFKVTASVAGTYSGSIRNPTITRSYPFSYTVVANTPTLVKIENIPGETSGTWVTTNAASLHISFDFGGGSTNKGTANTWAATSYTGVTGATALVAQVIGSTLDISDVQLEKGAFCTTFERKLYDQVLRECQRYYQVFQDYLIGGYNIAGSAVYIPINIIPMRITPTFTIAAAAYANASGFASWIQEANRTIASVNITATGYGYGQFGFNLAARL